MVLNAPFVGHGFERDPSDITGHGFVYYVSIGRGEREIVARAMDNGTGHVVYRREENFIRDYGDLFPLGDAVEWEDIDDLLKWIDSIIYYSFLRRSIAGVPRCWFLNRVSCLYTPQESHAAGLYTVYPMFIHLRLIQFQNFSASIQQRCHSMWIKFQVEITDLTHSIPAMVFAEVAQQYYGITVADIHPCNGWFPSNAPA